MRTQETLLRQLGFWDALTIGVGTMIGAGIFLLSGIAVALTGPAALFSYIGAGGVLLIALNVRGAKESGQAQVVVVLILFSLGWYTAWDRRRVDIVHARASFKAKWADVAYDVFGGLASETTGPIFRPDGASLPSRSLVRPGCGGFKRLKEAVGLTTSPEEGAV